MDDDSDVWNYFTKHTHDLGFTKHGKTDDPITYDDLSNIKNLKSKWKLNNDDMSHSATYSYPQKDSLEGASYPFPAFIKDAEGNYVHYGDWPTKEEVEKKSN